MNENTESAMKITTITRQELCRHRRWNEAQLDAARGLGHPSGQISVRSSPFGWSEPPRWKYSPEKSDAWVATYSRLSRDSARWPVSLAGETNRILQSELLRHLGWSAEDLALATTGLQFPPAHRTSIVDADGITRPARGFWRHEVAVWLDRARVVAGAPAREPVPAA